MYGKLQELTLFFKIPLDKKEDFFEFHTHFGQAPSKRFASPGLGFFL